MVHQRNWVVFGIPMLYSILMVTPVPATPSLVKGGAPCACAACAACATGSCTKCLPRQQLRFGLAGLPESSDEKQLGESQDYMNDGSIILVNHG